ncbi:MAG: hypothetical protein IJA77_06290, partial [Clostridia bacterium]|nr:hypothetical protein [Clostridia bacterium]
SRRSNENSVLRIPASRGQASHPAAFLVQYVTLREGRNGVMDIVCELYHISPSPVYAPWSFHLAVHFYPIPALHFAENFTALPA